MKDEKLWKEAKKLAGSEGLSAVIADALKEFVAKKRDENKGLSKITLHITRNWSGIDRNDSDSRKLIGPTFLRDAPAGEKLEFLGRHVARRAFSTPPDGVWRLAELTVFCTKGRKIVLAVRISVFSTVKAKEATNQLAENFAEDTLTPPSLPYPATAFDEFGDHEYSWYEVFPSLSALATDPLFAKINPADKGAFLNTIALALDDDWAIWIE